MCQKCDKNVTFILLPMSEVENVYSKSAVIYLQFWAYGSWDSLFPISMSPTANL